MVRFEFLEGNLGPLGERKREEERRGKEGRIGGRRKRRREEGRGG